MAPTTIDVISGKAGAPPLQGLLRLTTSGGTEVNLQIQQESSPKPLYIRGASGHFFASQAEVDPEPAKLDIPWPSSLMEKPPDHAAASCSAPTSAEEFACHKSQCSTEDPNEEASPPLSPRSALVSGATGELCRGSAELPPGIPTAGSIGHYAGKCKPCAFVFKDGCESGVNCAFCHLCSPGEKKRRKKERRRVVPVSSHRIKHSEDALVESQYDSQLYQAPIPPPPPISPWFQDAQPILDMNSHILGSKAWQLEKSQARCHATDWYAQQNHAWYSGYQGW